MEKETSSCPVCGSKIHESASNGGEFDINCPRCGKYRIGKKTCLLLSAKDLERRQRINLSYWLRGNPDSILTSSSIEGLLDLPTAPPQQRADALLQYLGKRFPKPGTNIKLIIPSTDQKKKSGPPISFPGDGDLSYVTLLEMEGVSGSEDLDELNYIYYGYLQLEKGYLTNGPDSALAQPTIQITPTGWARIEKITAGNIDSNLVFIAMDFNKEWDTLLVNAIEPAVREAGYDPKRVDKHQHNNDITDEIISLIRQSRFVVGDFSSGNQGAYYEAGFAKGLGRRVINLCRKDCINHLHFDRRQINHILWEEGKWDEAKDAIRFRIEATIGKGPLSFPPAKSTSEVSSE